MTAVPMNEMLVKGHRHWKAPAISTDIVKDSKCESDRLMMVQE